MDSKIEKADPISAEQPVRAKRQIIAPKDHVILRQIDDNDYNDDLLKPEEAGKLIKSEANVGIYEYKGQVVSVGKGVDDVKAGDFIHHAKHSGTVFTFDGENLLMLPQYLICGIEPK